MIRFALRIVNVLGFLVIFIIFMFLSGKDIKCAKVEDYDGAIFDKILSDLQRQKLQNEDIERTMKRMKKKLQSLRNENEDLRNTIEFLRKKQQKRTKQKKDVNTREDDLHPNDLQPSSSSCEPRLEDEVLKKKIKNDAVELLYSIKSKIKNINNSREMDTAIEDLRMQQTGMLIDIENLISSNDEWRKKEAEALEELVQNRIQYSQNPLLCRSARKLICLVKGNCGFGCQMHYVTYCLMVAFGTGRTLVLDPEDWSRNNVSWNKDFQPLSNTCQSWYSEFPNKWENDTQTDLEILLPRIEDIRYPPAQVPLSIPQDLAPRLKRVHGNPGVWWISQFVKYVFRGQDWLNSEMKNYTNQVNFDKPIVGVHIRRTDKLHHEASLHHVEEYMMHVDAWYDQYDMKHSRNISDKAQRRVFLATDDPEVVKEAKAKYSDYDFINFISFSQEASIEENRTTHDGLIGIFTDIHILSLCNYLVCTFSSQVCRMAYEMMQTYHADASDYFHSLDDIYYYGGMSSHNQVAIYAHKPKPDSDEIELQVGDIIGVAGNHWDGYSKGLNTRTNESGLYPSWKVEEIVREVKYPTYPQANETT